MIVKESAREAEKRGMRLTLDKVEEIALELKKAGVLETYGTSKEEGGE